MLGILLATTSFALLLRLPSVQTWTTHQIATYLSKELQTEVSVGGVDFSFFDHLILSEVLIKDQQQDTLLWTKKIDVGILRLGFKENEFNLGAIKLDRPSFYLKRLPGDAGLNIDFIIDYFSSSDTTKRPHRPTLITLRSLELADASFRYKDQRDTSTTPLINFEDIGLTNLYGKFDDVTILDDSIAARITNLTFHEKSGFHLTRLSTKAWISSTGMECKGLFLSTPFSKISTDLSFKTESYDDYNDFISKVYMRGEFGYSLVASRDIAFFTRELIGLERSVTFLGKVRGTVDDLKGKNIELGYASKTKFRGDISLTGLPEIDETFIHLKVEELVSNKKDIESIPMYPFNDPGVINVPDNIGMLGNVKFSGDFTGFINDFVAYGTFNTALGQVASDISLSKDTTTGRVKYSGNLKTFAFDIGRFYRVPETVGRLSMDVKVNGKGLVLDKMDLTVDGLVSSFTVKGYEYKNIKANGHLLKKIFEGAVSIDDPNMTFAFNGNVDFTQKLPLLDFTAEIRKADLTATNLYKGNERAIFSSTVVFKIRGNNIDNINGNIAALDTKFSIGEKSINVASLDLIASERGGQKAIQIWSDIADAEVKGKFDSKDIVNSFVYVLHTYLPSIYNEKKVPLPTEQEEFTFMIKAKKTDEVTQMFYPDIDLNSELLIKGNYSSGSASFNLSINNKSSIVHGLGINGLKVIAGAKDRQMKVETTISEVILSDTMSVQNIHADSRAMNDSVGFKLAWKNNDKRDNHGSFNGAVAFHPLLPAKLRIDPSEFVLQDSLWKVTSMGNILFDSTAILIPGFQVSNNHQVVKASGVLNQYAETPLEISFTDFNLANINPLLNPSGLSLYGMIQGKTSLYYKQKKLVFSSDLSFTDFVFNEEKLGNGNINAEWNPSKEGIKIDGKFLRGALPTIAFAGWYYPMSKTENFDIKFTLQKTQIKLIQPYIADIASDVKGFASGELFLKGTNNKPEVTGSVAMQKVGFKVDYLNTSYTFSNTVTLNKNSIDFGNMTLFDENGNEAIVNGSVKHSFFRDFTFDITINARNLLCLNTEAKDNQLYFGKAFTTGRIRIAGDPKNIVMDIKARTERGTQFNIPLEGSTDVSENTFIHFKGKDTVSVREKKYDVDLSGIQLNFDLEVTPEAEVQLIFDPKVGDIIKGRGYGDLKLEINTLGVFNMFGDYVIKEGDYLFTLQNIINKRFKVEQGGTITWSGNPYDAEINLNAVYKLRSSLSTLFDDTLASHRKRIPVDCVLKMSDKLMNPDIKFDIVLPPTVDESIRSEVRNRINPDNEQELNKQVFSLLILGTFYNPDQGFANNSSQVGTSAGANATELLSNQLSNWLSSSIKAVDVRVKYHGKDVEVNLSKELFNERLVIDGNVGVANSEKTSNIVGDAIVEYKVSKDGKFRVKAFRQTNDYSTSYTGATSKTGVGLSYREDFDTMGELLRRYREKFRKKKKSEATPTEQQPAETKPEDEKDVQGKQGQ